MQFHAAAILPLKDETFARLGRASYLRQYGFRGEVRSAALVSFDNPAPKWVQVIPRQMHVFPAQPLG